ncbi:quinon protein alcohol dehydrogenase-like superfamily [Lentinula raphanica]|nr:quinon protein alcohol dehydrogenase-like superfamily [Lentinula raphanica]
MFFPVIKASPDSRYIGYSSPSVQIVWDTLTWKEIISSSSCIQFYRCFALSNTHYLIGTELRKLTPATEPVLKLNIMEPQQVASCVFSSDGQAIALGLASGIVQLWSVIESSSQMVASHQLSSHVLDDENPLPALAFSPNNNILLVCFGSELHFIQIADNSLICHSGFFTVESATLTAVSFSPRGDLVAVRDNQQLALIWSTANIVNHCMNFHNDTFSKPAVCLTLMADSCFCLSGDVAGMLSVWNCNTGLLVQTWDAQMVEPMALSASPNGKFIACSNLKKSHIWSLSTLDCLDPSFEAKLVLTILAPPETQGFIPAFCAVTFSSDSTMLAITTAFIIDIWKFTDSRWQRFNQLKTSLRRLTLQERNPFININSLSSHSGGINYQWLAHHYHKLQVRAPRYLRPLITDAEYEEILQQHRGAFNLHLPSTTSSMYNNLVGPAKFQLYFSLDCRYVLAPSGIYEVATGEELANYKGDLLPQMNDKEMKYFWKNSKEWYQRSGTLKTLHPENSSPEVIVDTEGCYRFEISTISDFWQWRWYSCASDGNYFVYISGDPLSNLVFVHVPPVESDIMGPNESWVCLRDRIHVLQV